MIGYLRDFTILCLLMIGAALMEDHVWNTELGMFPFVGGYIYGVYSMEREKKTKRGQSWQS